MLNWSSHFYQISFREQDYEEQSPDLTNKKTHIPDKLDMGFE